MYALQPPAIQVDGLPAYVQGGEVTAAVIALCALSLGLTTFVILCGKWLHDANGEIGNLRDTMTAADAVSDAYKYERDQAVVELAVAKDLLAQEHTLRTIAETQRNEAMRRVGELLRKHVAKATNEEIQELTNEAFASPLSLVPRPAERVPQAVPRRSDSTADGLLDPDA